MREAETALAIALEERFRGMVCYWHTPPAKAAKKPKIIAILHPQRSNSTRIEVFTQGDRWDAEETIGKVYQYLLDATFSHETHDRARTLQFIRFAPADEAPTSCSIEGFEGFAFDAQFETGRDAT